METRLTVDMRGWLDKEIVGTTVTTAQLMIQFMQAFALTPTQVGELLGRYLKQWKYKQ